MPLVAFLPQTAFTSAGTETERSPSRGDCHAGRAPYGRRCRTRRRRASTHGWWSPARCNQRPPLWPCRRARDALPRFLDGMGDVVAEDDFANYGDAIAWGMADDGPDDEVQRLEYLGPEGDWRWAGALHG